MDQRFCSYAMLLFLLAAAVITACNENNPSGPSGDEFQLASRTLPMGMVGSLYLFEIFPSGGTTPYSYTVQTGNLPLGIAFTGKEENFELTGTPTEADTYTFSVTVTDQEGAEVTANFTMTVVDVLDLTGTWTFSIVVTQAGGDCEGEAGPTVYTSNIEIVQTGTDVTATGWLGDSSNELAGEVDDFRTVELDLEGCYPEDGGTTESQHDLALYTQNRMEGRELWRWWSEVNPQSCPPQGDANCPTGVATVTAMRQ